jgi:hypothetical protein
MFPPPGITPRQCSHFVANPSPFFVAENEGRPGREHAANCEGFGPAFGSTLSANFFEQIM